MMVTFAMPNLVGRAKAWDLGLKLHNPYVFGSYEFFKARLKQTFEPPRAEFRARAELLDLKQGKRDIHAYAQHTRYLVSCIVLNPIDEQTQITVFIKGLADGVVKTHLFRLKLESLDQAISAAEEGLQPEAGSCPFGILSSLKTTGGRSSRANGPLLC